MRKCEKLKKNSDIEDWNFKKALLIVNCVFLSVGGLKTLTFLLSMFNLKHNDPAYDQSFHKATGLKKIQTNKKKEKKH